MTDNSVFLGRISEDIPSQPEINPEATASFASIEHLKQMIRTGVLDIENHTEIQPEIEQIFQKFIHLASCGKCAPCREGTKRMRQLLKKIMEGNGTDQELDQLAELADMITNTALCGLGMKQYVIDPTVCKGCSRCAKQCPVDAISGQIRSPFVINPHKCIRCGSCTDTCAFHAISLTTFGYPA